MWILLCILFFGGCADEHQEVVVSTAEKLDKEPLEQDLFGQGALKDKPIEETTKESARTGEQIYIQICQSCHMPTGEGRIGLNPPLAGSEWVLKDPSVPIRIVLHGLMGEIEVVGIRYNSVMSPWGPHFNDQEIANVLNYIRNSWGNKAEIEITAAMVKEQREKYPGKTMWTASEL